MAARRGWMILAALLLPLATGCESVDWNWDFDWWQRPKRVVRPARGQPLKPDAEPAKPSSAPAAEEAPGTTERPGQATDEAQQQEQPAATADRPAPTAAKGTGEHAVSFYQLYLVNGEASRDAQAGERRLILAKAKARNCASLLEMLYVPTGRSGSDTECYLIYENRREFDAAAAMAPKLDVSDISTAQSTVGPEAAFRTGIGQLLWIVGQGASIDAKIVEECERHLAEAIQSAQLPAADRWAAGIMAGRLASEFRYDYAGARTYFRQAERLAPARSLEQMTARWWIADALAQDRKTTEARELYQTIVQDHAGDCGTCQVVRRSQAKLEREKKR